MPFLNFQIAQALHTSLKTAAAAKQTTLKQYCVDVLSRHQEILHAKPSAAERTLPLFEALARDPHAPVTRNP